MDGERASDFWGRINYEAYVRVVGGKAFNGDQLPTWDELRARPDQTIPNAWCAGADAVCAAAGL